LHFGADTTAGALAKYTQRHIKPNVERLQEVVKKGGDPRTLHIGADAKGENGK
jgi:hypothetical protein